MMEYSYGRNKTLLFKLEHELRQSLHAIMGMLELAAEEAASATQASYLSQCRMNADQLLQIANDVAELASLEPVRSLGSTFCLREMAEEVAEIMTALAVRKGLQFDLSIDPSVPKYVFSERDMIQDMLRRILDNSIKFTTQGSISLSVKSASAKGSDSALLAFEVTDNGPGIANEILEEFQTPFGSHRTGLGLSIVQKRLADLNGELTVQSSTSQGTVMRVLLPVTIASFAASVVESRASDPSNKEHRAAPLTLLVAEDSDDSYNLFQVYVKGEGHTVTRALNGLEAVEMVKSSEYDLIVMDIDMPQMDGYTATRTIREWETEQRRTRIPIVLLSAESASRQRRIGASAGCSGYLTKPVPKNDVLEALHYFSTPK
jgi:CheY-like chemotaxis protein